MDGLCKQLLSGSALTGDADTSVRSCDSFCDFDRAAHRFTLALDLIKGICRAVAHADCFFAKAVLPLLALIKIFQSNDPAFDPVLFHNV